MESDQMGIATVISLATDMTADAETLDTLASIERVLVADRCGVREALEAAYRLGRIDGMLEMQNRSAHYTEWTVDYFGCTLCRKLGKECPLCERNRLERPKCPIGVKK